MKLLLGIDRALDSPDADTIALSLAELDWEKDIFAILRRDKLTFIQATGSHRQGFILEYMDGSEERFFKATGSLNIEEVKSAFVAYSRGEGSWQTSVRWEKADPQVKGRRRRAILTLMSVVALISFFLFMAIMGILEKLHRPPN